MSEQARGFLMRNDVALDDIVSVLRIDGRTTIRTVDDRELATFISLKYFVEEFAPEQIVVANKGVALATAYISEVHGRTIVMQDGRTFEGRARGRVGLECTEQTSKLRGGNTLPSGGAPSSGAPGGIAGDDGGNSCGGDAYSEDAYSDDANSDDTRDDCARDAIASSITPSRQKLRDLAYGPAFCSLQLVFEGGSARFIVRYCTPRLASLLGVDAQQVQDDSFFGTVPGADRRWFPLFADVALNGTESSFSYGDDGAALYSAIHCYQPRKNYCNCTFLL